MRLRANLSADAALVVTTLIWGSTFIIAKDILAHWPPVAYLAFRFALASLVLCALFGREVWRAHARAWRAGLILGLLVGGGFALQAAGQVYTTASKSAFVTGLTTPLVPFVAYALLRARPSLENLLGVVLASIGGMLILLPRGAEAVNQGDLLTLAATALFAAHITLMSRYARRYELRQLTVLQITTATVLFLCVWAGAQLGARLLGAALLPQFLAREAVALVWSARVVWQLIYLALVGTLGAFLLWTWGQARMSATHAAIIFSLEPVFATAFAVAVRGASEGLGARGLVGAALVFAGIIVSELRWTKARARGSTIAVEGE
ncbi:MAG TPA: DMT family transporter [Pyrinomonadaceae bacterium]|nr:DMT family transporter [Pyrinomonadaceae bacterium]